MNSDPRIATLTPAVNERPNVDGPYKSLAAAVAAPKVFVPVAPKTIDETGLREIECRELILKCLLNAGSATGRYTAETVKLPFSLVTDQLRRMKTELLVAYRSSPRVDDFEYELTPTGVERARRLDEHCSYCGAAPVPLNQYTASVMAQSLSLQSFNGDRLKKALAGLTLDPRTIGQLGQAVCSSRTIFLYGPPGNGKTSIAERICRTFEPTIWIPRAIMIEGEIVRVFDPSLHQEVPVPSNAQDFDKRWVCINRPTVIVGGELTLENLELKSTNGTGILEAPMQLKSNCGVLVVDDFGRQRVPAKELLNRWIIPLERRVDYLNSPRGKKIQVPFEQVVVFSTNLSPRDLLDEAFLRRIPYKIEVQNPTELAFRFLLQQSAQAAGVMHSEKSVDYLIERHYRSVGRSMRACHARDLLQQIRNFCDFSGIAREMTSSAIDAAFENFFANI